MTIRIIIPKKIDEELDLEVGENAYIVQENENPTTIIFCRGTKKGKIIHEPYEVQNFNQKTKTTNTLFSYDYAIVNVPNNKFKIPNQHKCRKLMLFEPEGNDFLIILR